MSNPINLDTSQLQRALDLAAEHLDNTEPLMESISRALVSETMENFRLQGRPAWAGLSPKYHRHGGAILQDTGELRRSIRGSHTVDTASVGTNLVYAPTHQFGAEMGEYGTYGGMPVPFNDIPARPFIPMDNDGNIDHEAFLTVSEIVNGYLVGAFG